MLENLTPVIAEVDMDREFLIKWGNDHPEPFRRGYFNLSDENKKRYIKSYESWGSRVNLS